MNTKTTTAYVLVLFIAFSFCFTSDAKPRTNYSEQHFRKDITRGKEIEKILQWIDESNEAEFHRTEISGLGFVSFKSSPKEIYMITLSRDNELTFVCKAPKEDHYDIKSEVIWPLEWNGRTAEEFYENQAPLTTPEAAPPSS
ncbi:hypothetical protein IEN85_22290 [Pelagicoccus sp. NFK12]|uniref:Uncharacterized protein n=1 Tax=Pelagicoccus enzymogenes TaxID=2773457 RepID=A0A927FDA0_9BACT|nr:hypothetical protein [Pelagicoccus enzymogenes]MBD5782245.1 hypothetical protein [Pelagicoccus enzymogenes]